MAANTRRSSRGKRDVYREITGRILDSLEAGTVPWRRPWRDFGMQRNYSSGRPYRGVNQLLTQLTQQAHGYGSPFWLTYRGAQRAGGNVRRGERGSMVVLWNRLVVEDEQTAEKRTVWWVRPYSVFNLDQVDGVDPPLLQDDLLQFRPIERCESLLGAMRNPPAVEHRPGGAFYLPASDTITLPPRESFREVEGYYATRFHETVHSTGHPSRLDRELVPRSQEEAYSREELIAELGAAMLCGLAGTAPARIEQSAAYIASWLRVLRDDRRMVVSAAQQAQRAVDHIRNEQPPEAETINGEAASEATEGIGPHSAGTAR
jgi:antirestriction protein ArdC